MGLVAGVFNAVMDVRVNQFFRERFQAPAGRYDLGKNFCTIPIFLQHAFHGIELADDFANAHNESALFFFWMVMHGGSIRSDERRVKNLMTNKGYGGIR